MGGRSDDLPTVHDSSFEKEENMGAFASTSIVCKSLVVSAPRSYDKLGTHVETVDASVQVEGQRVLVEEGDEEAGERQFFGSLQLIGCWIFRPSVPWKSELHQRPR